MSREGLAFAWWFGLERHPKLTAVLEALFLANGAPVRMEPKEVAKKAIFRLRTAMDSQAIDTTEAGYNLTDVGLGECNRALVEFGAWATGRAA